MQVVECDSSTIARPGAYTLGLMACSALSHTCGTSVTGRRTTVTVGRMSEHGGVSGTYAPYTAAVQEE